MIVPQLLDIARLFARAYPDLPVYAISCTVGMSEEPIVRFQLTGAGERNITMIRAIARDYGTSPQRRDLPGLVDYRVLVLIGNTPVEIWDFPARVRSAEPGRSVIQHDTTGEFADHPDDLEPPADWHWYVPLLDDAAAEDDRATIEAYAVAGQA